MKTKAYGALAADRALQPLSIERRAVGSHDVQIAIAFCGVWHSDLHQARSEWQGTLYPSSDPPGHTLGGYSQRIVVDDIDNSTLDV